MPHLGQFDACLVRAAHLIQHVPAQMRMAEQAEEQRRAAEQAAVSARAAEQARKAALAEERRLKLEAEVQVRLFACVSLPSATSWLQATDRLPRSGIRSCTASLFRANQSRVTRPELMPCDAQS